MEARPHRRSRLYAPGIDYLVCISIQATVDENLSNPYAVQVTKDIAEIIELAWAIVDTDTLTITYTNSVHVRPQFTPLTPFCTALTKITWDMLENAPNLREGLEIFDKSLRERILNKKKTLSFVTHGSWDLRIQLPREARDKAIQLPPYLARASMFDIKREAEKFLAYHPDLTLNNYSLSSMCSAFDVELLGPQHSGLNDTLTIVNLVRFFCASDAPEVFVTPVDSQADYLVFLREQSKVIHLASLPFELTQSQLEAWFAIYGARPHTLLVISSPEGQKPRGSGFAIFETHEEALECLDLNGRVLLDRVVEVNPSSERVLETAGGILTPFPTQAVQSSKSHMRPGDWLCNVCGFSNFQRRTECLKCGSPSAINPPVHLQNPYLVTSPILEQRSPLSPHSPHAIVASRLAPLNTQVPSSGGPSNSQEFRKGDWICPVLGCAYHNFARNSRCMQCGATKVQSNPIGQGPSFSPSSASFGGPTSPYGNIMNMAGAAGTSALGIVGIPANSAESPSIIGAGGSLPPNPAKPMPGDWACSCGFVNWRRRKTCLRCGNNAPIEYGMTRSPLQPMPSGGVAHLASPASDYFQLGAYSSGMQQSYQETAMPSVHNTAFDPFNSQDPPYISPQGRPKPVGYPGQQPRGSQTFSPQPSQQQQQPSQQQQQQQQTSRPASSPFDFSPWD